jgi:predicted RNase H-like HicB family nuclease
MVRARRVPGDHQSARQAEAVPSTTMNRTVHLPYVVEQDEDGVWCAHAQLRPGVGAHGEGDTAEAAIDDLRESLSGLITEFGLPNELTLDVDVA